MGGKKGYRLRREVGSSLSLPRSAANTPQGLALLPTSCGRARCEQVSHKLNPALHAVHPICLCPCAYFPPAPCLTLCRVSGGPVIQNPSRWPRLRFLSLVPHLRSRHFKNRGACVQRAWPQLQRLTKPNANKARSPEHPSSALPQLSSAAMDWTVLTPG